MIFVSYQDDQNDLDRQAQQIAEEKERRAEQEIKDAEDRMYQAEQDKKEAEAQQNGSRGTFKIF